VEEYIAGREFTVLVAANGDAANSCTVFKPVEYLFPEGREFKTYALKTSELHPDCNVPCKDKKLETKLRKASERIFRGFGGVGYARLDFRVNEKGKLFFLEINFTCSVFYKDGYEGSADFILKFDGIGQAGFLQLMIQEGIARHRRKQKKFRVRGNSIAGYGICATENIAAGEIVSQRLATRRYVEQHWNEDQKEIFRRYAYPVSNEVFLLWDDDPSRWAPQNHSCSPNTVCNGLYAIALRDIEKGEELTLDYAVFLDEHMESFVCRCGTKGCRGLISGTAHNSVTEREKKARSLK
jgi:D-alanine-D-alanine ligase